MARPKRPGAAPRRPSATSAPVLTLGTGDDLHAEALRLWQTWDGDPNSWSDHARPFLTKWPDTQERTTALRRARAHRLLESRR